MSNRQKGYADLSLTPRKKWIQTIIRLRENGKYTNHQWGVVKRQFNKSFVAEMDFGDHHMDSYATNVLTTLFPDINKEDEQ